MFDRCSSLEELPDISNWNTRQVINMCSLFRECSKIKLLPDISIWNIINVEDIREMFYGYINLESLPNILLNLNNKKNILKGKDINLSIYFIKQIKK